MSDLRVRLPEPETHEPVGRDRFPGVLPVRALCSDPPSEAEAAQFTALLAERRRLKPAGKSTSYAFGGTPR